MTFWKTISHLENPKSDDDQTNMQIARNIESILGWRRLKHYFDPILVLNTSQYA